MSNPKQTRVWIELEKPADQADGDRIAELANNMIQRLAGKERADKFFWSASERRYCLGGDHGYKTLTDNGEWFDLEQLGRAIEAEQQSGVDMEKLTARWVRRAKGRELKPGTKKYAEQQLEFFIGAQAAADVAGVRFNTNVFLLLAVGRYAADMYPGHTKFLEEQS